MKQALFFTCCLFILFTVSSITSATTVEWRNTKLNPTSPAWPQTLHDEYLSNRIPFNYAHNNWYQTIQVSNMSMFTPKGMIDSYEYQIKFILQNQLDSTQFHLQSVNLMSGSIQLSGLKQKTEIPKSLQFPTYLYASGSMVGDKNGNMYMFATNDTFHYGSISNYLLVVQSNEKTISCINLSKYGNDMDFYKLSGLLIDEVNNHLVISSTSHIMALDIPTLSVKWKQQLRSYKAQAIDLSGNIISINGNGNVALFVATVNSIFKIQSSNGMIISIVHLNQPEYENGEVGIGSISSIDGSDLLVAIMNGENTYASALYFINMDNQQYSAQVISDPETNHEFYSCFAPTTFSQYRKNGNSFYEEARVTFACKSSFIDAGNHIVMLSASANLTQENQWMGKQFTSPNVDFTLPLTINGNTNFHHWIGAASDERDLVAVLDMKSMHMKTFTVKDSHVHQHGDLDLSYAVDLWNGQCHIYTASNGKLYTCCKNKNTISCHSIQYYN